MKRRLLAFGIVLLSGLIVAAQVDGVRTATGMPISVDARIIYGRVTIEGMDTGSKLPQVFVTLWDKRSRATRTPVNNDGYYYFHDVTADGGMVVVEVNGTEVARQSLMTVGPKQQRMDFFVTLTQRPILAKPGTVSAKTIYDRNKENAELMSKAVDAIEDRKPERAIPLLARVVAADPADHPAWTILGASYSATGEAAKAEEAFLKALELEPKSVPALLSLGRFYVAQKRFDSSVGVLEKATVLDPASAVAFRLLGESYLQIRKGSKAIPALNEAIRLQPKEMAECHLLLAKLYDIVGARHLASAEFKMFLEKVPDHPDKNKIKTYIKDNPPQETQ